MTGTNRLTGFAGWLRHVTSNTPLLYRLSIHRRLALCFIFVIVLILVGERALLRQLHLIRAQAERLDGLTEELIEVQRVHTSLTSIYNRLGVSAQFEDSVRLLKEWDTLRTGLLDEAQRTQAAFRDLPPEVKVDPTMLTTLESIARTEHRMFLVVPITGFVTLLIAAGLGVAISNGIAEPLRLLI